MASYGSGVVLTGEIDNADSDEHSVYLYAGESHSFWVAGFDTAGAGYLANPRLTLAGDPGDPDTAGITPVVADDNAEGANAVINYTATIDGWYTLTVDNGAGTGGLYDLIDNNKSFETDILDHTGLGTKGTDAVLAVNDTLLSDIARASDSDVVAVTLTAGVAYSIDLRGASGGFGTLVDPILSLLDADGAVVLQNDNFSGLNAHIDFTPSSTGTYFLRADGVTSSTGTYQLHVDDGTTTDNVPGATTSAFSAQLGGTIQGTVDGAGDQDWYAIQLAGTFSYQFDLVSDGLSNPLIELRNSSGGLVTSNDNGGGGVNARLTFTATDSGLYYLVARDAGSGTGGFKLTAAMTEPPPPSLIIVGADSAAVHAVSMTGSDASDDLYGTNLGDTIDGSAGDDYILGDDGSDILIGGAGDDFFDEVGAGDAVTAGDGIDTIVATVSYDLAADAEVLGLLGTADLDGSGTSGDNGLYGNDGANRLEGKGGLDWFEGGTGNDTLIGGFGSDTMFGGIGDDSLDGGDFNGFNWLQGDAGNDMLVGGVQIDTLVGGDGNDTLIGGGGINDFLDGGAGSDTASYAMAWGAVSVSLLVTGAQETGNVGVDTLISIENLFGGPGADRLTGNAGTNSLYGGAANDTLIGGGGKDLITGAGGLDVMKINALADSGITFATRDVINTFAHGDKVDLSAIDANSRTAGNQAFTFVTNFTRAAGQLQWDQTAPAGWLVTGDLNGDGVADFSLQIYASTAFGHPYAWDFIL
jgi:hypothetical protein